MAVKVKYLKKKIPNHSVKNLNQNQETKLVLIKRNRLTNFCG